MLISRQNRESLNTILKNLKLIDVYNESGGDRACKIEQIIAYLEIIHSRLRHYSKKRRLVMVDSGAGNCYLSFLINYYYTTIEPRNIVIHCVDRNEQLMLKRRETALEMGYKQMYFHACDIARYKHSGKVDLLYALHACDSATDKTLHFGIKHQATTMLSVSCCQHGMRRALRNSRYAGITKHSIYKDKFVYMVGDSLRGLLLEMLGYKVSIFEFVSSRYTDKNIMLRAQKSNGKKIQEIRAEYEKIKHEFQVKPALEIYLNDSGTLLSS